MDADTLASEALAAVATDAARACGLAREALARARAEGDGAAESTATRALGLAAREQGDLDTSLGELRRAIRIAETHGHPRQAADARVSLCGTLALKGRWTAALREADRAAAALTGPDQARVIVQKASVQWLSGRLDEAEKAYGRALPPLRRASDQHWLGLLHLNRGLVRFQRGALAAAEADLDEAERIHSAAGADRLVAHTRQSLGLVLARRGDVPRALEMFDLAEEHFRSQGAVDPKLLCDRCEALLGTRLLAEARACAETAAAAFAAQGSPIFEATAQMRIAEAALLQREWHAAAQAASAASRLYRRRNQSRRADLARLLALRAAWMGGERSAELLSGARRVAAALKAGGFRAEAVEARVLAAQVATATGRSGIARRELEEARRSRASAPVQVRVRAWHAEALLRLATGNRRGAETALRAGVRVVDEYRLAFGASDLRAHAAGYTADLAATGMGLAVAAADPVAALRWAELSRTAESTLHPVRPATSGRVAAALDELRSVVAAIDERASVGSPTAALRARQRELEEEVRRRARHARGTAGARRTGLPTPAAILATLAPACLIELAEVEGLLWAVAGSASSLRLVPLAPASAVAAELDVLLFALRRTLAGQGSPRALAATEDQIGRAAQRLDEMLLGPLASLGGLAPLADEGPLLIVPTGPLHALPWALLPSCRGRSLAVAPSLTAAARAHQARGKAPPVAEDRVVLVSGPGLAMAEAETRSLARQYPGCLRLGGAEASCGAVLRALDGAGMAHLAAHGRFRPDNALFSSIELADGALTVYDLGGLGRPPATVVLAACDSGVSEVAPGDQLMGLAAAFLEMGTSSLVAPATGVPDGATAAVMLSLHSHLRAGLSVPAALAATQATATGPDTLVAASFVAFGAPGD